MKRNPLRIRLTLDAGLAAYVRAYTKGVGLYGTERETIVAFVREGINRRCEGDVLLEKMMPHLPPDIQRAWLHRANVKNPMRKAARR